jgi:hypothetical protein
MSRFTISDTVTWTSTSGGTAKTKTGQIVAVIPAGDTLRKYTSDLQSTNCTLWMLEEYSPPRDHETYVVKVGRKFYRPLVKNLLLAAKPDERQRVYLVTEVWGTHIDEVAVNVYPTRAAGMEAFRKCVTEWLDGSARDVEAELEACGEQFTHSEGFIRLNEEVVA